MMLPLMGTKKIVMRAELSAEGDHAKFEFDSIDSKGRHRGLLEEVR